MSKPEDVAAPPKLHDVVWAKVDGYPYWPAVVCRPPKSDPQTASDRTHVRFFDDATSRAWVKLRQIIPFTGSWNRKVPFQRLNKAWMKGVEEAVRALSMDASGRPALFPPIAECEGEQAGSSTEEEDDSLKLPQRSRSRSRTPSESSEGSDIDYNPGRASSRSSSSSGRQGGHSVHNLESRRKVLHKKAHKRKPPSPKGSQLGSAAKRPAIHRSSTAASRQAGKRAGKPGDEPSTAGAAGQQLEMADFLADDKRRDAFGRHMNHPEFNPRTLRIPESFKAKLTPAMRQWWELKESHFDAIVFFKVGREYMLYHMDAAVGVKQLGLALTEGKVPSCSIPENAYSSHSAMLIDKGYKVARVEEMEAAKTVQERGRRMSRLSKVDSEVRREICRITTKATRTFGPQDDQCCGPEACYLLAIAHQEVEGGIAFGICFVDTSIRKFHLGQFIDDDDCSRLRTALLCYPPAQVLYEQEAPLPEGLLQILEGPLHSVLQEALRPWKEFPDARRALQQLRDGLYFAAITGGKGSQYPKALAKFIHPADTTHLEPRDDDCLALKALGACVWYLCEAQVDLEVLTMRSMDLYVPPDTRLDRTSPEASKRCLVLDAACLQSLAVLQNPSGGTEGTLLAAMDFCCTHFGKRLFRLWLSAPPCDVAQIQDYRQAVDDLLSLPEEADKLRNILHSLPDFERLMARIFSQSLVDKTGSSHPDQQAVLCEEAAYNQRRMATLMQAVDGFESALQLVALWEPILHKLTSRLLKTDTSLGGELFPQLLKALYDVRRAIIYRKKDLPLLSPAAYPDYDAAVQCAMEAEGALRDYLRAQGHHFGCEVALVSSGEHQDEMEVPEDVAHLADCTHQLQGRREGSRYYSTEELKRLTANVARAKGSKEALFKAALCDMSQKFNRWRHVWGPTVQRLAQLDCLQSLATFSRSLEGDHPVCTPHFLPPESTGPWLRIKAGHHPCLLNQADTSGDLCLGNPEARTAKGDPLLLGGQPTTLSHQAALLVIIAHLGARVPAELCELTPVDRIITRIGPSSRLASGEGAPSVNVDEAALPKAATRHSLVLLDG